MTKTFKFILLLLIVTSTVTLSACGDDKDDDHNESAIVGSWTCSRRYYGGSDTYTFYRNGKYSWTYNGTADWFQNDNGTYTYNGTILTTTRSSGYVDVYVVIGMSNTSMTIMDDEGDSYTYYRN